MTICFASASAFDGALVERPNDGAAPTAFRIWGAGRLEADGAGDEPETIWVDFTERSAELILAEQARRGRLYPFDFDHLSLRSNRPAEAGRAAGYFRLEVRRDAEGGAELWAIDIEWSPDVKVGLEEKPPRWRYFSPAFDFSNSTQEIVSFTNCAICINPRTHNPPALACLSKTEDPKMEIEAMIQALADAIANMGDGPDKDKLLVVKASLEKQKGAGAGDESGGDVEAAAASAAAEDSAPKEEEKATAEAAKTTNLSKSTDDIPKRVRALELSALFDKRPDINPKLRAELSALPIEQARKIVATLSAPSAPLKTAATVGGDGGDGEKPKTKSTAQLAIEAQVDRALGLRRSTPQTLGFATERNAEGRYELATMTPSEARARAAAKKGEQK